MTPKNALAWTEGRALIATGSPFTPAEHDGILHQVGQANNVFIFPGVGLGAITARPKQITDGMFLAAARALADAVTDDMVEQGRLYPDMSDVQDVSRSVAIAVAEAAIEEGLAEPLDDVEEAVDHERWGPEYLAYRAAGD